MLTRIADKMWVVSPQGPPKYPYCNCLYIEDEEPAVIDMGAGTRAFAEIPCERVQYGLISHFHFDHLHCDGLFPNARIFGAEEEAGTYKDPDVYTEFHGYNMWEEMMGQPRPPFMSVLPDDVPAVPGFREIRLDGLLHDGDVIDLGKRKILVVHLPGHTVGHYGFWFDEEGILFSGDIDLVANGPWYSSKSADVGALYKSIRRVKELNPRLIIPSHRRPVMDNIKERLDRYIKVVEDREERILELLKRPLTLEDLSSYALVFPEPKNNIYEVFWEKMTLRNHLRYLLREGYIREVTPGVYLRV